MCIYKDIYKKWLRLLGTTNKWDSNMPNYPWHMKIVKNCLTSTDHLKLLTSTTNS